jgi:hypothetical protein
MWTNSEPDEDKVRLLVGDVYSILWPVKMVFRRGRK